MVTQSDKDAMINEYRDLLKNCLIEPFNKKERFLLTEYDKAITLYLHEDDLIWKKFYNFLLISGILLPAFSYFTESTLAQSIFSFVGVILSISLFITVTNSYIYRSQHKARAYQIEKMLTVSNIPIMKTFTDLQDIKIFLKYFRTIDIIRLVCVLLAIMWILLLLHVNNINFHINLIIFI